MAYNYNKLKGKIVEKFGTQINFAEQMGMSERTLSLKLNNKIFFRQNEITRAAKLLEISGDEIQLYFFTTKVK